MTVRELIAALEPIENKDAVVCFAEPTDEGETWPVTDVCVEAVCAQVTLTA